ncbi:hypothetical protein [Natranaerobius thermophilus]|uniref:Uncharacterized protein n=1 Tax=Natranaerobius thermophilus (strain ATCC BAA-1301 / DSM 18059 / JW/NM-WN-LF) TaxID=457570 RepID=B2A4L8_NATTJ|nr:hypothetical protein [Natranaerobius thermophilus]ACB85193.1 hypothetical protein Nther_1619 [Natranaerobius thermophilus JW/NM-WN-LF]
MPYSVMVIIFLVIIGVFLFLRFSAHFNACRRVSEKHPGENIEGCPNWTLIDESGEKTQEEYEDEDKE